MKKFLKNIVKLKKISTIKDFRFGTFPSISGSGSGSGYTFYRPPPFCARKRCNLEGMTAKISVLFPEQNVDLTDLYTKFTH